MSYLDCIKDDGKGWETLNFLYSSALKKTNTLVDILSDEFIHIHHYNPIEHTKSRLKTPESIVSKLKKNGHDVTLKNVIQYVHDIAGIRIICSFTPDIYTIADMLSKQDGLKVLEIKDYIKNPKESGYMSYHMLVSIPIYLSESTEEIKVEIQIRTIAMDFWASLEHKIYYKFEGNAPAYIHHNLKSCAEMVAALDHEMWSLNEAIQNSSKEQVASEHLEEP